MGVGPGPTSLALSPRAPLSHWGAVSPTDPLGAVAGTPSLLCPPTAHTLVKHSRKSFGAIRESVVPTQAAPAGFILSGGGVGAGSAGKGTGHFNMQGRAARLPEPSSPSQSFAPPWPVGWEARGGEEAALRTQVAVHLGSCGQVQMGSGGLDPVP